MLEANYLTILLKPNYEKAVDTAEDVLDMGLTTLSGPYTQSSVERMKKSPYYLIRAIAEKTFVAKVIFWKI